MRRQKDLVGRRESLRQFSAFVAASPLLAAQQDPDGRPAVRLAPVEEIIAAPEFEQMAELVLSPEQFEKIRGGSRGAFDRMTFRQRLMVYAMDLDLTTELFGHQMFAPIIVGPVGNQGDLHPDGELATARGSSAAQTIMVTTRHASHPPEQVAAHTDQPLWYQVYAADSDNDADANDDNVDDDPGALRDDISAAVTAGCQVLCVTVGISPGGAPVAIDWKTVEQLVQSAGVPVIVKGIMNGNDAQRALDHGAQGLVVSNHGGAVGLGDVLPVEVLATIADAVDGRAPVLVDGSFQRGSDILKGLALGATAVMLARPMMWGLTAYGAAGVETALRLLIHELARNMAASGRPTIEMIDRELVRFDSR